MSMQLTDQGVLVLDFINQTKRHVFLTGKAGTGKTTLLKEILERTYKMVVVAAPTGIAALNAGGVTIHSLFQLPFDSFLPQDFYDASNSIFFETPRTLRNHTRMSREKLRVIRALDVLIIDEVSMLRSDLLDALELTMRRVRGINQSFGGAQVLFIGDLMQLPPVVKNNELAILSKFYKSSYFFDATCLQTNPPVYIELSKIFRQEDENFIDLLNRIRNSELNDSDYQFLDKFYQPNYNSSKNPGVILLTTHNHKATRINQQNLEALKAQSKTYYADIEGDFPDKIYPVEAELNLKIGAQVMFTRNDSQPEKRYFNGKIGLVEFLDDKSIQVRCNEDKKLIHVELAEWENVKYNINESSKEVEQEVIGVFRQFPLRLAWAITIHKSQGLTFTKAALDVEDIFQSGQAYVAFSRLRSLDGLILASKLSTRQFQTEAPISEFASQNPADAEVKTELAKQSQVFMQDLLLSSFDIRPLVASWKQIVQSHREEKDGSVKAAFRNWTKEMLEKILPMETVSENFNRFINQRFEPMKYPELLEKVKAARQYFSKELENFACELLLHLEALSHKKRTKAYFNEMNEFDDRFFSFLSKMNNSATVFECFVQGKEIDKKKMNNQFTEQFKRNVQSKVLDHSQKSPKKEVVTKVLEESTPKVKKPREKNKKEKVDTVELTFEMFKSGLRPEEIAKKREFALSTIEGHLSKMIESGAIQVLELMDAERVEYLMPKLKDFDPSLGLRAAKDQLGDEYGFGEIKMVLAEIQRQKNLTSTPD